MSGSTRSGRTVSGSTRRYHEAGGTVSTADETLDGVVAETEVVGFSDRGDVLRVPIVTVYSKAAQ